MPTSRADSGSAAAARIARPTRVNWKKKYSATSSSSVTPIMPAWWVEISWLPRNGEEPNGVGNGLMVKSQMKPATLLMIANSAMKPTTWVSTGALASGLNSSALDHDAAGEGDGERQQEGPPVGHAPLHQLPGDEGREHRHFALGEIQMVDRLVDHHDGERHAGIDRAGGDAGQDLVGKQFHGPAPQ